jgi:DNA-binding LacI/PurR family transcriptional regulator
MAVAHLIEHGHRHIACLSGPKHWLPVGDRVDGYLEVMQSHGLTPLVRSAPGYLVVEAGYEMMRQALLDHPEITAVFAANDPMAVGAINAARDLGRKVPQEVAVVGFDNLYWTENMDPPLTTVYIHKEQIGILAARRLLELIQKGPQIPMDIRVKNELVVRQSCGCPPRAANGHHVENDPRR